MKFEIAEDGGYVFIANPEDVAVVVDVLGLPDEAPYAGQVFAYIYFKHGIPAVMVRGTASDVHARLCEYFDAVTERPTRWVHHFH